MSAIKVIKKLGETTKLKQDEIFCSICREIKPKCFATSRVTNQPVCKKCEEQEAIDEYCNKKPLK